MADIVNSLRIISNASGQGLARVVDVRQIKGTVPPDRQTGKSPALLVLEPLSGNGVPESFTSNLTNFLGDNSTVPSSLSNLSSASVTLLQQVEEGTLPPLGPQLPPLGPQLAPLGESKEASEGDSDSDDTNSNSQGTQNSYASLLQDNSQSSDSDKAAQLQLLKDLGVIKDSFASSDMQFTLPSLISESTTALTAATGSSNVSTAGLDRSDYFSALAKQAAAAYANTLASIASGNTSDLNIAA